MKDDTNFHQDVAEINNHELEMESYQVKIWGCNYSKCSGIISFRDIEIVRNLTHFLKLY